MVKARMSFLKQENIKYPEGKCTMFFSIFPTAAPKDEIKDGNIKEKGHLPEINARQAYIKIRNGNRR